MEQQRFRQRVAAITSALAKGLSVYAPPRHIQSKEEQVKMLGHMAETVNRYIEADANDGVIAERIARAFSMLAATYDRRDWPTPAVMVEAVKAAKPQRAIEGPADWLKGKPLELIRWLGYYAKRDEYPGGMVINPDTVEKYEDEARKRYNDLVSQLSENERAAMHKRFDALPQAKRHHDAVMAKLDGWRFQRQEMVERGLVTPEALTERGLA
jgi:hypothetical protein